jgi:hypothetical protein
VVTLYIAFLVREDQRTTNDSVPATKDDGQQETEYSFGDMIVVLKDII